MKYRYCYMEMEGKRYGKLVVERVIRRHGEKVICECICDCGNRCTKLASNVINGKTRSCGCGRFEANADLKRANYDDIVERIDAGERVEEIAREKGVSRQTIYCRYRKMKIGR